DLAATITLSDEELQKYLDEHADPYRVPARVRARYVAYRPADFLSQVEVKDEDVAEYYALHKDDKFTEPEQVRARHILVKVAADAGADAKAAARKKAEEILAKVKAGADFAALAKERSEDPGSAANGGDLGLFARGRMTPAFEEAAFARREGEVSDLIESPDAIYLLSPFTYSEAHTPPLDEVRERVAADAHRERGEAAARERADKLLARAREIGLDQAAAEAGVRVEETGPFERVDSIPKIGRVADLTADAFTLAPEAPFAPKVYATGGDAIEVALRARTPADMAGFEGAKDGLRETLLKQKREAV